MEVSFFKEFVPPKTTNQQRRQNSCGGYLHDAGRVAKAQWQAVLELYRPDAPQKGALTLELSLTWPHTVKSAASAKKSGVHAIPKITRPDGDNLIKMIKDVMQTVGYFDDDAQVFDERITRWHGDMPGVFVRLRQF